MKTEEFHKIEITYPDLPPQTLKDVNNYCFGFDWYPEMIDSLDQNRRAFMRNKHIVEELEKLGVTKAVIRGFMTIGGKVQDKFLIGAD